MVNGTIGVVPEVCACFVVDKLNLFKGCYGGQLTLISEAIMYYVDESGKMSDNQHGFR